MKLDDVDQILLSEKRIEPSASFTKDVMERIQAEPSHPLKIQWPRILLVVATLAVSILIAVMFPSEKVLESTNFITNGITNWLLHPSCPALCTALLLLSLSMIGTLVLIWLSLRIAGAK